MTTSKTLRVVLSGVFALFCLAGPVSSAWGSFGFPSGSEGFAASAENADGTTVVQAGSHPYAFTTTLRFNQVSSPINGSLIPEGSVRDVHVAIPPGLVGNPTVADACTAAQFETRGFLPSGEAISTSCPNSSVIGTVTLQFETAHEGIIPLHTLPVFNLVPPPGFPAEFGFNFAEVPVTLTPHIRPDGTYGLTVDSINTSQALPIYSVKVAIWGVPYDPRHDAERGTCLIFHGTCPISAPPKAYLTLPASCGGAQTTTVMADDWQNPGAYLPDGEPNLLDPNWVSATSEPLGLEGCNRIPFSPILGVRSTTDQTASSSGLNVDLNIADEGLTSSEGIAQSDLNKAVVTLPEGFTVNPSAGAGLGACSEAQYESETVHSAPGTGCPENSKLGDVEIESPLVEQNVNGAVYLAKQNENPFHTLLALYIVAKNPAIGVIIKSAGKVEANSVTGQIVSTFENLPQLPFSHFRLSFHQGQTSPLVSPPTCGTYTSTADLTPWSDTQRPLHDTSSFRIEAGIGGGPCPTGGVPPFKPTAIAGTQSNSGASYSPFYLRIDRNDGEQEITKFSTIMPPGLSGNLTGIPFCPEAAIETARAATGQQELNAPSCPAASEIGHSLVGAGVGSVLAWTPGKVYLAGPYHGASLSIVSVTSATVGPFDLGTVVIRFALRINPTTAQVEVDSTRSDPIPHIIDGIVVHVRDIHVYIDRHDFILNPTSCNPMGISNTITGAGADFTNPADQDPVTLDTPFQAADCAKLTFKPTFKASTSGKTSRTKGASLTVKLAYPNGSFGNAANIRSVKVDLPKQLPSRLSTLQKACVDSVFNANPAACPAASRVGTAKAITPILPVPLEGPAYFVSHGGAKFPELIIVLQGYGITIDLFGETFINKAGITSSTFRAVPDQPVTSFELTLPQGPGSALAANGNLCNTKLKMPTLFTAQNGTVIKQATPITVTQCPKARKAKGKKAGEHRRKKK